MLRYVQVRTHAKCSQILDIIDRPTLKGKRDYAIVMLGTVTGLRASDIAILKLTDIDWINGEIKIVQSKTGGSLALPLTKNVGEAIKDYILYSKQQTEFDAVFLRHRAPLQGLANSLGFLYISHRASGLFQSRQAGQ